MHVSICVPRGCPRRRRWPLFLPFAIVVLLAVAWTGLWFYAAARTETEIAAWRAREWQAGRFQDCASQTIGGYPFRIEVRCGAATFELKGAPTLRLTLPSVLVAAQIYDPTLLISEFTGPLDISEPDRPPQYIANWNLGQASVRGLPSAVERASLVLDRPTVSDPNIVGSDDHIQGAAIGAAWPPGSWLHARQSGDRNRVAARRRSRRPAPSVGRKAHRCRH